MVPSVWHSYMNIWIKNVSAIRILWGQILSKPSGLHFSMKSLSWSKPLALLWLPGMGNTRTLRIPEFVYLEISIPQDTVQIYTSLAINVFLSHTWTHTKSVDRENFCSYFFNVSQWAGNILDEIFSKEYIQLPSTINLTMTTKFLWQFFFFQFESSMWFCLLVSMYFGTVRDQHCYSNKKANKTTL